MNTEHEFVQSPHRAQWPFPAAEPMPYRPAWYEAAQAASAITDDEQDHGPEMLGAMLLIGAAVAIAVVGYFAFLY